MDQVLLFGVLPFPFLPFNRLLPEMHRILKPEGKLSVWMFPVSGWVPGYNQILSLNTRIAEGANASIGLFEDMLPAVRHL